SPPGQAEATRQAPRRSRRFVAGIVALLALVTVALLGMVLRSSGAPDLPAHPAAIAVLPFANLGPDGGDEYFSDGMAEEIMTALSRVEGLRVAARTSAFAF